MLFWCDDMHIMLSGKFCKLGFEKKTKASIKHPLLKVKGKSAINTRHIHRCRKVKSGYFP